MHAQLLFILALLTRVPRAASAPPSESVMIERLLLKLRAHGIPMDVPALLRGDDEPAVAVAAPVGRPPIPVDAALRAHGIPIDVPALLHDDSVTILSQSLIPFDQYLPQSIKQTHYRAVMLIVATHGAEVYRTARRVWLAYINFEPSIKIFFVYGRGALSHSELTEHDLQFDDIEESFNPGLALKTLRAMEELVERRKYTFDFFVRTNISTLWNLKRLLENLNYLPTQLCYSGHGPQQDPHGNIFLSGIDTIVNGYMIPQYIKLAKEGHLNLIVNEDVAMALIFHGQLGAPLLRSNVWILEHFEEQSLLQEAIDEGMAAGADHFRVKARINRENIDFMAYKILLKTIYDITLT